MASNTLEIITFGAAMALGTFVVGCGDGGTDTSSSSSGEGESGGGEEAGDGDSGDGDCEHPSNEGAAEAGTACTANSDCESNLCLLYSDAPLDDTAVCGQKPGACRTRVTGTVFDFMTRAPVDGGQDVTIAGAIAASILPTNITSPEATTIVGGDGTIDITSEGRIEQPLGIVAVVEGGGYHLSATGLESPVEMNFYGAGTSIHDLWAVSLTDLDDWNTMLAGDTALAESLPLGEKGGVIGKARDEVTGDPMAGIMIDSTNDGSSALIRYLNEAGDAFDGTETGSSGLFIIVEPDLGETFNSLRGGEVLGEGTAGSADGSLFIMIMDVPAP